jgi:hypothetical protein
MVVCGPNRVMMRGPALYPTTVYKRWSGGLVGQGLPGGQVRFRPPKGARPWNPCWPARPITLVRPFSTGTVWGDGNSVRVFGGGEAILIKVHGA